MQALTGTNCYLITAIVYFFTFINYMVINLLKVSFVIIMIPAILAYVAHQCYEIMFW